MGSNEFKAPKQQAPVAVKNPPSKPQVTPAATQPQAPIHPNSPPPPKPQSAPVNNNPSKPALGAARPVTKPIQFEDFDVLKVIGRGSYGTVYLVKKKDTGK